MMQPNVAFTASLDSAKLMAHNQEAKVVRRVQFKLGLDFDLTLTEWLDAEPLRQKLEELFHGRSARYRYAVHPGAQHGYSLPQRDVHDAQAAAADWQAIYAMYERVLRNASTGR